MLFKYTIAFSALIMLQACGVEPEGIESNLKLTDQSTDGTTAQAETKTLPTADETSTFTAPEPSKESTVSEVLTAQVIVQEEPASPARAIFIATGLDFFLVEERDQSIVYCREQDQLACEAALEQAKVLDLTRPWTIAFRPNEEILTANGFTSPPPSVESILNQRGIFDYEMDGSLITVFASQEGDGQSALIVLGIFYPDTEWSLATKPDPLPVPEEPAPEPELPMNPS